MDLKWESVCGNSIGWTEQTISISYKDISSYNFGNVPIDTPRVPSFSSRAENVCGVGIRAPGLRGGMRYSDWIKNISRKIMENKLVTYMKINASWRSAEREISIPNFNAGTGI